QVALNGQRVGSRQLGLRGQPRQQRQRQCTLIFHCTQLCHLMAASQGATAARVPTLVSLDANRRGIISPTYFAADVLNSGDGRVSVYRSKRQRVSNGIPAWAAGRTADPQIPGVDRKAHGYRAGAA